MKWDKVVGFCTDYNNRSAVRHIGFSAAVVVMVVGIVTLIVAIVADIITLGLIGAGLMVLGFATFPVTDLNFPTRGGW